MNMELVEPLTLAKALSRFYCKARPQAKKSAAAMPRNALSQKQPYKH
jgi:hypothetical protein